MSSSLNEIKFATLDVTALSDSVSACSLQCKVWEVSSDIEKHHESWGAWSGKSTLVLAQQKQPKAGGFSFLSRFMQKNISPEDTSSAAMQWAAPGLNYKEQTKLRLHSWAKGGEQALKQRIATKEGSSRTLQARTKKRTALRQRNHKAKACVHPNTN